MPQSQYEPYPGYNQGLKPDINAGPQVIFSATGVGGPNPKINATDRDIRTGESKISQIRRRELAQIAKARETEAKRKELQAQYYQTGNRVIKVDAAGAVKFVPSPEELYDLGDPIAAAQASIAIKANELAHLTTQERLELGDIDIGTAADKTDIRGQALTMKAMDEEQLDPMTLTDVDVAAMGYSNAPKAINPYMAVASGDLEQMNTALEQRLRMVERARGDSSKDGEVKMLMDGIEKAMERQGKQSSSEVKDDQARQKELARLQEAFHDTSLEYEKRKAELGIPSSGAWPEGAADDPTLRLLREKKARIKRQAQAINGTVAQVSAQGPNAQLPLTEQEQPEQAQAEPQGPIADQVESLLLQLMEDEDAQMNAGLPQVPTGTPLQVPEETLRKLRRR